MAQHEGTLITNLGCAVVPEPFINKKYVIPCGAARFVPHRSPFAGCSDPEWDCELHFYNSPDNIVERCIFNEGMPISIITEVPGIMPGSLVVLRYNHNLYQLFAKPGKKISIMSGIESMVPQLLKEAFEDG